MGAMTTEAANGLPARLGVDAAANVIGSDTGGSRSWQADTQQRHLARAFAAAPASSGAATAAMSAPASPLAACSGFATWQTDTVAGSPHWDTAATAAASIADAGTEVFDAALVSPRFVIPAGGLRLRWRQHTQLSWASTAGVLEIAVDGGDWTDFRSAGGRFLSGGYDSRTFAGNPLGARAAWGGEEQVFETRAELPATLGTRAVQLRFRLGSGGTGDARPGWRLERLSCLQD